MSGMNKFRTVGLFAGLSLVMLVAVAACGGTSPTATPVPVATSTPTPTPVVSGPFSEASLRALLSVDEIESSLGIEVGEATFIDYTQQGNSPSTEQGVDNFLGLNYAQAEGSSEVTLTVIEFTSHDFVESHITLAKTDLPLISTDRTIGDDSLVIQEPSPAPQNGIAVVMFWKDNRAISLNALGLPQTPEVLDGLLDLAELADSRL